MNKTFTYSKKLKSPKFTEEKEQTMIDLLDSLNLKEEEPSQNVIDNILNYSKALSIRKSKNINFIETVLN